MESILIYENDARNFSTMMKITWQSCGRNNLDKPTMAYWFNKLSHYEFIEVEKAFDNWLKSQSELPTIADILKLCQHKVTIHARLPSPLAIADNKRHASEVVKFINANLKKDKTDYLTWAKRMDKNPKDYDAKYVSEAREILRSREFNLASDVIV